MVGQKFTYGKLSREITKIAGGEIYYRIEKSCWITTFQDWIKKSEKLNCKNANNPAIQVTKRATDYHACMKGNEGLWGCGRNVCEAIGSLIMNHPNEFNIEINEK